MADIPQSRTEEILYATINGEEYTGLPESRIEELLLELKQVIESGGGGGGGTTNYNLLENLPQINSIELKGNKSLADLGIIAEIKKAMDMITGYFDNTADYSAGDIVVYDKKLYKFTVDHTAGDWNSLEVSQTTVEELLSGKVDKETGKGLSSNDYTNADKAIVDGVTSALAGKANNATTLAGYGITDAYTKSEVNTALEEKAAIDDVPTKTSDLTNDSNFVVDTHFEQTVTLSTSTETVVTFSNSAILATSLIDVAISEWGTIPSDVTVTSGVCTLTFPIASNAHSVTVRIYVR